MNEITGCRVPDCHRAERAHGYCLAHYWVQGRPAVSYVTAHRWVYREKGRADDHDCQHCGDAAEQWAYDNADPHAYFERGRGAYSPDPSHYLPLCRPCHRLFDSEYRLGRAV